MYWPVGVPSVFDQDLPLETRPVSHDGLDAINEEEGPDTSASTPQQGISPLSTPPVRDEPNEQLTKARLARHNRRHSRSPNLKTLGHSLVDNGDIIDARCSRSGHLFATITATSLTVWQVKPTAIVASVVRSRRSLDTYGPNQRLLLRPDAAIVVLQTSNSYLITYSLATDPEARTYELVFADSSRRHARRKSSVHLSGHGHKEKAFMVDAPSRVHEASLRFRMVIKLDAGIKTALALQDELVIATSYPPSIQCIRWTPNHREAQTGTQAMAQMTWLKSSSPVHEIVHDRPMALFIWLMEDGTAHAVQRTQIMAGDDDGSHQMFKGHTFHLPDRPQHAAVHAAINSKFSLVAVGLVDGSIWLYQIRDYEGGVTLFRKLYLPLSSSSSGQITTISYSPDGYCLFVGYENGWATWTVYGQPGASSFSCDREISQSKEEYWLTNIQDAFWVGGGSDIVLLPPKTYQFSIMEFARSAAAGCFSSANISRALLQTSSGVMVYQGQDMADLTTISSDISLWHQVQVPSEYISTQWPLRCSVISPDGRYVAVAGQHGLAHYSVQSGRWKTFDSVAEQNSFIVRGGMCWHQHILIAAVETSAMAHELRLYSREKALNASGVMHAVAMTLPVIHIASSGDDSILVYTMENILDHYIVVAENKKVRLVKVGQIGLHGIVRSPARVRAVSWVVPDQQLQSGDPSQDVSVATVFFLIDGKLVLLQPSVTEEGELRYDMRFAANHVEYYLLARDGLSDQSETLALAGAGPPDVDDSLRDSLWLFDGQQMRVWTDVNDLLEAVPSEYGRDMPQPVGVTLDFFPLSVLVHRGIIIGAEAEILQRRDAGFSYFRTIARTTLFIPPMLRHQLSQFNSSAALHLSDRFAHLPYFTHALEILLHSVLDEEAEKPQPAEQALLPGVLSFLSSFPDYLDIVVQCTRKTEVRSWKTLFAHLPPPVVLFETSLASNQLKTAAGYLLVLHTLEEINADSPQVTRLLRAAKAAQDWELCKELARFLVAIDGSGDTLRQALAAVEQPPTEAELNPTPIIRPPVNGGRSRSSSKLSIVTNGGAFGAVGEAVGPGPGPETIDEAD